MRKEIEPKIKIQIQIVMEQVICTTIEQSQRLIAAGIDPHTADMTWHHNNSRIKVLEWELKPFKPRFFEGESVKMMEKIAEFSNKFRKDFLKMPNPEARDAKAQYEEMYGKDVPAWSFMGLLKIMPKKVRKDNVDYKLRISWEEDEDMIYYVNKDHKTLRFGRRVTPDSTDLLDSLVVMLEWLKQYNYM
jgi:hypothetical protein